MIWPLNHYLKEYLWRIILENASVIHHVKTFDIVGTLVWWKDWSFPIDLVDNESSRTTVVKIA